MKALVIASVAAVAVTAIAAGIYFATSQTTVELPPIVIAAKHMEIVTPPQGAKTPQLIDIKSGNPSVATAQLYRANQIQIVAIAPGKTIVEFFDTANRILYKKPVWVESENWTGGGGAGLDQTRIQLAQIVMLPKHAQDVQVPAASEHQLSSVTSSNPSVATGRTNTRDTIQIYSVALGDTWINFDDNANGKRYQVHVWVVNDLKFEPPPLPPPGPNPLPPGPGTSPKPGDSPKPEPNPDNKIDPCLVGEWETAAVSGAATGGNGFRLTIKADGTQIVDYSAMEILRVHDLTYRYRGIAEGLLTTENGVARNLSIKQAGATLAMGNIDGEQAAKPYQGMGPGALGINKNNNSYTCMGDSLKYMTEDFRGNVFLQITMKRSNEVTP